MANSASTLLPPALLLGLGGLLLIPWLRGGHAVWLPCGTFFLSVAGFALLLLLAWRRPAARLTAPLRSGPVSLGMVLVLLGLVGWALAALLQG